MISFFSAAVSRGHPRLSRRSSSTLKMAAIGSKRKRFLGDGNDAMQVTSLVKSPIGLPGCDPDLFGEERYFDRVDPSPASMFSSRVAVQTDMTGTRCVAFVATSGGVWRHSVPFAGGTDVREGKEAMLMFTEVADGVTDRLNRVNHKSEIQSLAMHDPHGTWDFTGGDDDADVRLASVDSHGRCKISFVNRLGGVNDVNSSAEDSASAGRLIDLKPWRAPGTGTTFVPGWAGAAFDGCDPNAVAVARHFAKTVDVFDLKNPTKSTRTFHTTLNPHSVSWVDRSGAASNKSAAPLLAVAEGNQLAMYDLRMAEKGGCARRMTLCNRGQPLYAVSTGTSQGNLGGGAVNLPNLKAGEPLVATAGAERGVHVLNADRWSVVKRWPAAIKFEITLLELSAASPDHAYLAGLDYELVCGCWSRGALAGGFAFRGDGRWLGVARAAGISNPEVPGSNPGGGGPGVDIVAGFTEKGSLFAARVNRVPHDTCPGYESIAKVAAPVIDDE